VSNRNLDPKVEAQIRRNYNCMMVLAVGAIALFAAAEAATSYVDSLTRERPMQIDPAGDIASQLVEAYKNLPPIQQPG
jgi:hypothetical protein